MTTSELSIDQRVAAMQEQVATAQTPAAPPIDPGAALLAERAHWAEEDAQIVRLQQRAAVGQQQAIAALTAALPPALRQTLAEGEQAVRHAQRELEAAAQAIAHHARQRPTSGPLTEWAQRSGPLLLERDGYAERVREAEQTLVAARQRATQELRRLALGAVQAAQQQRSAVVADYRPRIEAKQRELTQLREEAMQAERRAIAAVERAQLAVDALPDDDEPPPLQRAA